MSSPFPYVMPPADATAARVAPIRTRVMRARTRPDEFVPSAAPPPPSRGGFFSTRLAGEPTERELAAEMAAYSNPFTGAALLPRDVIRSGRLVREHGIKGIPAAGLLTAASLLALLPGGQADDAARAEAMRLSRELADEAARTLRPAYGEGARGLLRVQHRSPFATGGMPGGAVLPELAGTRAATAARGAERARISEGLGLPASYFTPVGAEVERAFGAMPFATGTVERSRLFDKSMPFERWPTGLQDAMRAVRQDEQPLAMERWLRDHGYAGVIDTQRGAPAVALFEPLRVLPGRGNIRGGREALIDITALPPEEQLRAARAGEHLKQTARGTIVGAPPGTRGLLGLQRLSDAYDRELAMAGPEDFSWYPRSRAGAETLVGEDIYNRSLFGFLQAMGSSQRNQAPNLRRTTGMWNLLAAGREPSELTDVATDVLPHFTLRLEEARRIVQQARRERWTQQQTVDALGELLGPKTGPYGVDVTPGVPYSTSSVKDVHNLRSWGFTESTGRASPQTHAFLQGETLMAAERRSLRERGTPLSPEEVNEWMQSTQSGPWVVQKASSLGRRFPRRPVEQNVAEARETVNEVWPEVAARVTYESTPGPTSGVLPGLLADPALRERFGHDVLQTAVHQPTGQDVFYRGAGLLQGPVRPTRGIFQGGTSPALTAYPLLSLLSRDITPVSRAILDQTEAIRALLTAQDVPSWSFLHPTAGGRHAAFRMSLGGRRPLSDQQLMDISGKAWDDFGLGLNYAGGNELLFTQAGPEAGGKPWLRGPALTQARRQLQSDLARIIGGGDVPLLERLQGSSGYNPLFPTEVPTDVAALGGPVVRALEQDIPSVEPMAWAQGVLEGGRSRWGETLEPSGAAWLRPDGRIVPLPPHTIHVDALPRVKGLAPYDDLFTHAQREGLVRLEWSPSGINVDMGRALTPAQTETVQRLTGLARRATGERPTVMVESPFGFANTMEAPRIPEMLSEQAAGLAAAEPGLDIPVGPFGNAPRTRALFDLLESEHHVAPRTAERVFASPEVRAHVANLAEAAGRYSGAAGGVDPRYRHLWEVLQEPVTAYQSTLQTLRNAERVTPWMLPAIGGLLAAPTLLGRRDLNQ